MEVIIFLVVLVLFFLSEMYITTIESRKIKYLESIGFRIIKNYTIPHDEIYSFKMHRRIYLGDGMYVSQRVTDDEIREMTLKQIQQKYKAICNKGKFYHATDQ